MTKWVCGLITAAVLAVTTSPIAAQTNGPYYATPSWDQQIPAAQRFIVLSNWNNLAVLDRETGLVWQRSPDSSGQTSWFEANYACHFLGGFPAIGGVLVGTPSGGRLGWRLPSIEELASLVDRTQSNPALPAGHPFQGVQNTFYWSATTLEGRPTEGYFVNFSEGAIINDDKTRLFHFWCVRGSQGTQGTQ